MKQHTSPFLKISRTKKILFSLVPVSVLLVVLVIAEILIRIFVPSEAESLATEEVFDKIQWYQVNRKYLGKYFPAGTPVIPEFKPGLFRKQKSERHFRVICLGGSTMFGTPYLMTSNIPGIVRKQLRHLYPDHEIEVINWGASAINSNVVEDLAGDLLQFEPDLVLLYMGHNEFYGPDGVGVSFLEKSIPGVTRLKYALRDLRLMQMLQKWVIGAVRAEGSTDEPNLMLQVSEETLVPLQSADAERVFDLFEENLSSIVTLFKNASVPIIVSDVSSNLLFPPFVSDSVSVRGAGQLEESMEAAHAIGDFRKVVQLAGTMPDEELTASSLYRLGRASLALGEVETALRLLEQARDRDLLKFRAPGRINEIIRAVCEQQSVAMVSSDSAIAAQSGGVPGDEIFWEHLHPKTYGYYLIATLFVDAIQRMGLVREAEADVKRSLLPFHPDSLSICWLDQAYADLSIQRLTGRWPFQNYRRSTAVLREADPVVLQIAMETYGRRITWDEGCHRSATYFWSRGRFRDALTTYEALLEEYPYGFYTHYLLGSLWNSLGDTEKSFDHYLRSIGSNHEFPRSQLDVGLLSVNAGEFDQAIVFLTRALELVGTDGETDLRATALYGLSAAHANKGEIDKALAYLDTVLELVPNHRDARALRAQILQETAR